MKAVKIKTQDNSEDKKKLILGMIEDIKRIIKGKVRKGRVLRSDSKNIKR